jgi:hypothetical protein
MAGLVALLAAAFFPRVYPAAQRGPDCTDLAHPLGGNNRSILAQQGNFASALRLDVNLPKTQIQPGESLPVEVTFINEHYGPVILHFDRTDPILSRSDAFGNVIQGVTFEITRISNNTALIDQTTPPTVPPSFDYEQLHLLGSRTRCTESFSLSGEKLSRIGLQPGEYRLRAFYRNTNPGTLPQTGPSGSPPTATPAYTDQGVWVGSASSSEVRFSVVLPGTPVPPG